MTEDTGALLSAAEVGRRIGRGDDTVRRMWEQGLLPFVEINGRRVTPEGALNKWLDDLAQTAMGNVKEQK